VNLVPGER